MGGGGAEVNNDGGKGGLSIMFTMGKNIEIIKE